LSAILRAPAKHLAIFKTGGRLTARVASLKIVLETPTTGKFKTLGVPAGETRVSSRWKLSEAKAPAVSIEWPSGSSPKNELIIIRLIYLA